MAIARLLFQGCHLRFGLAQWLMSAVALTIPLSQSPQRQETLGHPRTRLRGAAGSPRRP